MKNSFYNELRRNKFRVAIFGSARIRKNDEIYKQIYEIGKVLGEKGIDVVTGGGPGLMNAASAGHKAARKGNGSHAIGLNIKLPRRQIINANINLKKEFGRFSRRLDNFMLLSNAVVVAPGGLGTLLEFFYTLQLMQVEQICNIPVILVGDMWKGLIEWLRKQPMKKKYFEEKDLNFIFIAKNTDEVLAIIEKARESFKKGDKNFCFNYKKYKF